MGKLDLGWHRNSIPPTWRLLTAASNFTDVFSTLGYGLPVEGDYDGDGKTDVAGFFATPDLYGVNGTWSFLVSTGFTYSFNFGNRTDIPVPGDFDGDGKADVAVYRPPTTRGASCSHPRTTRRPAWSSLADGVDIPVPADYDGDGITDIAVYRRATGQWFIINSSTNTTTTATWGGGPTDLPEPGDYDGDGKADLAVFGGGVNQRWLILKSSTGTSLTINSGSGEVAGTGQLIDYAVEMLAMAQVSESLARERLRQRSQERSHVLPAIERRRGTR